MIKYIFFVTGVIFVSACGLMSNPEYPDAGEIKLAWEFLGNDVEHEFSSEVLTIENLSKQTLGDENWKFYFNQMGEGVIQESVTGNVRIDHVIGDLLCISPLDDFNLGPGETVEIRYHKPGRLIKVTEAPGGPYFVFGDPEGNNQKIVAVESYIVKPFPSLEKIFPPETDIPLPGAGWVFERNLHLKKLDPAQVGKIIPTPVHAVSSGETEIIGSGLKIHYKKGLETEADYLAGMLEDLLGEAPTVAANGEGGANTILLNTAEAGPASSREAYRLSVRTGEGISITGNSASGVFYGIQSFLAMVPPEVWGSPQANIKLECVTINDSPAFEYRGIMLDIARNFNGPDAIKKLIDAMAFYKMNRLHLSLTNDEGWRLEIPALPELTEIGGHRGHNRESRGHLLPAYGSGPYPDNEESHGNGALTRDEFIDILKYAANRHIEVIPEVNFPGHARAAICAMEARYERLKAEGKLEEAEKYRLSDPMDQSGYNSAQNFNDNVVCVCKEAPFLFYETVVGEILNMYREAGVELKVIHTGGDEVPHGSWAGSPICETFLERDSEISDAGDLQAYFEGRLLDMLARRNLVMAGWEEVALKKNEKGRWIPNPAFIDRGMLPYVWNSLGKDLDLGNRLANAGYPVVLCNVDNFYFDLAYTHHPAEPGLYWGGFVNTRQAFEFIPFNVFHSVLTDPYRRPFGPGQRFDGMEAMKPEARKNIAGLQGQLWSETIKGEEMLEYYYLPKMLGLAERAWAGQPGWGDIEETSARMEAINSAWNQFANEIGQREMPRLDHIFGGYYYRLPPPGAVIRGGMLHANIDFPGLTIRYTTDGTEPTMDSPVYTVPVAITGTDVIPGPVLLRSFDSRGRGSRVSVPDL
jgi:hexosaminidase